MKIGLRVNKDDNGKFVNVDNAFLELGIGGGQIASTVTTHEPSMSTHHSNFILEGKEMIQIIQNTKDGYIEMEQGGVFDASFPDSETRRGRVQEKGTVSPTITAQNQELYKIEKVGQISNDGSQCGTVISDHGLFPTISAGVHGYANPHLCTQYRIRKLTPLECYRLMGVDDTDAKKMLEVNSNSQCYKQAGNSIVVDVMAAMFERLF